MRDHSVCQFVTASSIREDIVRVLSKQQQPTPKLIDKLDACRSGVYKELSNLKQQGALTETEEGWRLTACGQLVTDTIERRQATEAFLGRDMEYWQQHDIDLLPERFRRRLPEIGEYEIVRGGLPAVNEHVTELLTRMDAADSCDVLTPIFVQGLGEAIPDSPDSRVLVTSEVHDRLIETGTPGLSPFSEAKVRVAPSDIGVSCTDDSLCLVFPGRTEGEWTATLVAETESAIEWGTDLFESLWAEAEPIDDDDDRTLSGRCGMVGTYPTSSNGLY